MLKTTFGVALAAVEMESEINKLQMEHASKGLEGEEAVKAQEELEKKIMEKGTSIPPSLNSAFRPASFFFSSLTKNIFISKV